MVVLEKSTDDSINIKASQSTLLLDILQVQSSWDIMTIFICFYV